MVIKDHVFSFYRRNNTQKYPMDTIELYNTFLRHGNEQRDIAAFVDRRLIELYEPHLSDLNSAPQVILHFIPSDHFQNMVLPKFFENKFLDFVQDLFEPTSNRTHNRHAYGFNGLHLLGEQRNISAYFNLDGALLFRSGAVEVIQTTLFSPWTKNHLFNGSFYAFKFVQSLMRYIDSMLKYCDYMEVASSFYLSIRIKNLGRSSLVGKGGEVAGHFSDSHLFFPIWFITGPSEVENVLNMLFDTLYQAVGLMQCPVDLKEEFKGKYSATGALG
jgi:hypothetical protein